MTTNIDRKKIGERVTFYRERAGYKTCSALAKVIDMSSTGLLLIENGSNLPSLATLLLLTNALTVPIADLVGVKETEPKYLQTRSVGFYRTYGLIDKLDVADQKLIREIVERLYESY